MKIEVFFPADELLRKHIECYHISNFDDEYIEQNVFIYPHYLHTVSLQRNLSTFFSDDQFTFQTQKTGKPTLCILGRFTKPLHCKVDGFGKALTIVFKPTGINFFCDQSFEEIVPGIFNSFPFWNDKLDELEKLLYMRDISAITRKLENILLSFYRPFENKILSETLSLLHEDYACHNVKEIERTLRVNRKTLARQFKKQIGVSVTDYRRILRFRDAIKLHSATDETLTKLAYETCFSDQSHFIKDMQKLTGDNPKKFFKEVCSANDSAFILKKTLRCPEITISPDSFLLILFEKKQINKYERSNKFAQKDG